MGVLRQLKIKDMKSTTESKKLMSMIEGLLQGKFSVKKFRENYYDYYLDDVSDESLTESESGFFGHVHEMLDWVDESPDRESRNNGWLDDQEFLEWLKSYKNDFD